MIDVALGAENNEKITQGSYRQDCVKFKDFPRTSQGLRYCFQGMKT